MRRRFLTVLFVLALAQTAFAGQPGTWTFAGIEALPSTSAMGMAVGTLNDSSFVMASFVLSSDSALVIATKSNDYGETIYEVCRGADVGAAPMVTAGDCFNETYCLAGGINMLGLKMGIWRSDGAGEQGTWSDATPDIQLPLGSAITLIKGFSDTFGVAVGGPALILATYDDGATWTQMTSPMLGDDVQIDAADFKDENIGFVTTGYIPEKSGKSTDDVEILRHRILMASSPLYRFQWIEEHKSETKAVLEEGIFKTTDGGVTWTTLVDKMNWYGTRLSMSSEQYGCVITSESYGDHGDNAIRCTEDGGLTWDLSTLPAEVPDYTYANYIIGDIYMMDADLGYAAIMFGAGSLPMGGNFLVTTDGGKNWDWDPSGNMDGGFMGMDIVHKDYGYAVGVSLGRARYVGNANSAPTADAGADSESNVDSETTLDGTGSSDPESDTLMYKWEQTDGPGVTMDTPFGPTNTFVPTAEGTVTFQLTVSDGQYLATDTVTYEVGPALVDDDTGDDGDDDDDTVTDDTAGDDDGGSCSDNSSDSSSGSCGC